MKNIHKYQHKRHVISKKNKERQKRHRTTHNDNERPITTKNDKERSITIKNDKEQQRMTERDIKNR